jgi:hypothetical protein
VFYLNINAHLCYNLAELFLGCETLDNKQKRKEKHILCSSFFPRKSFRLCDDVEKYGTAWQATDGSTIWRRKNAICKLDN